MKKTILLIVAVLAIGYIIFDKIGDIGLTKEFTQKQDSLVQAVDSMKLDLVQDSIKDIIAKITLSYRLFFFLSFVDTLENSEGYPLNL